MVCILRPGDGKDGNQDFRLGAAAPLGYVLRGLSSSRREEAAASCGGRSLGLELCCEGSALRRELGALGSNHTPSCVPLGQSRHLSGLPFPHWQSRPAWDCSGILLWVSEAWGQSQ